MRCLCIEALLLTAEESVFGDLARARLGGDNIYGVHVSFLFTAAMKICYPGIAVGLLRWSTAAGCSER